MIPLNYHHLYYFYVTAKSGSIAKACKTLLLSQPAVSTQLKQLERSLGNPLFERKSQRLFLTEEGRFVLDYAESIFEMGQELQDSLKDRPRSGRPVLRAGIVSGTPRAFGHAMLECILDAFPSAHVDVREGQGEALLADLREQRLDMLLTDQSIRSQDREALSTHLVGKVPIVLAAAPGVARRYRHLPGDLDGAPFILPSWPSHIYHQVLDLLAEWKVEPRVVAEVQDAELARHLAISGRGIAPLNAFTVSVNAPPRSLTILNAGRALGLYESVYLVSRRRKFANPMVERLVKEFRLPAKAA
ncbi:MAG: LysR family transcriptional regulator [Elusimicrobia bacterium]|nr:LysR family transcriptional regulator [Elusimicrobiota bacterium]